MPAMDTLMEAQLDYPHAGPPEGGVMFPVAPGLWWLRMPLPFRLDHINLWLAKDGEHLAAIDTGIAMSKTRALWEKLFAGDFAGRRLSKIVVTHMHPDHVGLAGWLNERFGAPLYMSLGEYHSTQNTMRGFGDSETDSRRRFYLANGIPESGLDAFARHRGGFKQVVSELPPDYVRIMEGKPLFLDGRRWEIIAGFGHSPEHCSLYCAELGVLIAGDQVLPKITTNVSVWPIEPMANSLQWFLDSIEKFRTLPPDTLVLPSHGLPFRGLHRRLDQLVAHHDERLDVLRAACAIEDGKHGVELTPTLFPGKVLDEHQFVFALGETLAHLHCLEGRGQAERLIGKDGVHRFRTIGPAPTGVELHDVDDPEMV
jgi:glyoxylase-like metal-dependent hydrolase (beta-lactamase superfamily II)